MQTQRNRSETSLVANQRGMISIMTTMILMIVISLIVLGFAQQARRNQRSTLDRQLSTQAFYAAESGVNDAAELIKNATLAQLSDKTSCSDKGTANVYASLVDSNSIDSAHNVSYTCVLIDPSPNELDYDSVSTTGTIVPMFSGTGGAFSTVNLEWKSKTGSGTPTTGCPNNYTSTSTVFTPTTSWTCGYGVMRIDLVPASGSNTTGGYQTAARTVFAVPVKAGTNTYNFGSEGNKVIGVTCTDTSCKLTVSGLTDSQYYMRLISLYQDASMSITSTLGLKGAQVKIDSTGKAQDVLRRIQVRLPLNSTGSQNQLPDNALQSTDSICKRFSAMDNYLNLSNIVDGDNALCQ
ncbi:MAG TPA: PilX N-terminal domain-containing pilus assembly protein [Candidatus Saccharimonadales bacterium]|nr:PilX N-terminal domain-containing pilus assembly protein [Candidatus Saccharimonadales bacterium]